MLAASRTSFQMAVSRAARSKAAGSFRAAAVISDPVGQCSTMRSGNNSLVRLSSDRAWGHRPCCSLPVLQMFSHRASGRAGTVGVYAITQWTGPGDLAPTTPYLRRRNFTQAWAAGQESLRHTRGDWGRQGSPTGPITEAMFASLFTLKPSGWRLPKRYSRACTAAPPFPPAFAASAERLSKFDTTHHASQCCPYNRLCALLTSETLVQNQFHDGPSSGSCSF